MLSWVDELNLVFFVELEWIIVLWEGLDCFKQEFFFGKRSAVPEVWQGLMRFAYRWSIFQFVRGSRFLSLIDCWCSRLWCLNLFLNYLLNLNQFIALKFPFRLHLDRMLWAFLNQCWILCLLLVLFFRLKYLLFVYLDEVLFLVFH